MKLRMSLPCALLCMVMILISAHPGSAQALQPLQPQEPEWLTQKYAEGWQKVQEGVLQRTGEGGQHETVTIFNCASTASLERGQRRVHIPAK